MFSPALSESSRSLSYLTSVQYHPVFLAFNTSATIVGVVNRLLLLGNLNHSLLSMLFGSLNQRIKMRLCYITP